MIPISTGQTSEANDSFQPGNSIAPTFRAVAPKPTMHAACKESQRAMAFFKQPNNLGFWVCLQDFMNYLAPDWLIMQVQGYFTRYMYQLCVSNMVASLEAPWTFAGGQVEWASVVGIDSSLSLSVTTLHETVKIAACTDLGYSSVSTKEMLKAIETALLQR